MLVSQTALLFFLTFWVHHSSCLVFAVAVNWDYSDELIAAKMVGSGIPLDEPFLQRRLLHIVKEEMKSPKGGKLPVSDCFYVMGTADPTGTLNSNEVCVILYVLKSYYLSYVPSYVTFVLIINLYLFLLSFESLSLLFDLDPSQVTLFKDLEA